MADEAVVQIRIDHCEGSPAFEKVPADELGNGTYRLRASPGFASGFAYGDLIEEQAESDAGFVVKERSGFISIQVFLTSCSIEQQASMQERFKQIKGWLDGGLNRKSGTLLIFNVPVTAGFGAIEKVIEEIQHEFPVESWMYGNVYGLDGITPLNWWRDPRFNQCS